MKAPMLLVMLEAQVMTVRLSALADVPCGLSNDSARSNI